jgi:serine/threonine protein kinase
MLKDTDLYLIDFGIASSVPPNICDITTDPHRTTVIGSPKYISYYVHSGYEPMYRDDLISIGYCFFYFILGKLPWDDVSSSDNTPPTHLLHEKNQIRKKWKQLNNIEKIIQNIRQKTSVELSGDYNEIYKNISEYFALCYNLQLDEKPFYDELITVLRPIREDTDNV